MNQKRNNTRSAAALLALLGTVLPAAANNIKVDNVRTRNLDAGAKTVDIVFDLSWENSWRNDVNHDAAWVFVKFRAPTSNDWQHAYLATNAGVHSAPGAVIAVGTNDAAGVGAGLGMGVFVSANSTKVQGDANYPGTSLRWNFGASGYEFTAGSEIDVSVHAIEMVYVAEGPFYVGSGGTESGSFTDGSRVSGATIPFRIASEGALEIGPQAGNLWGTSTGGDNRIGAAGTLAAAFPKGYGAFYCMKYSITQGQYAEFLNLLTPAQQTARAYTGGANRHTISKVGDEYVAGAPDRACNNISWQDVAAYLDWSGLRPMTELEYEKACRGPEYPVANEYAWGSNSTLGLGSIITTDGGDGSGLEFYTGNLNGGNPIRVGSFATNGADRVKAGASYWGIMELSGYPAEQAISVASGRSFTGLHGNGVLHATTGLSTGVANWPDAGIRGGHWDFGAGRVSDRISADRVFTHRRDIPLGGRAVRSAP